MSDEYRNVEKIATLDNESQALLLDSVLNERDIPHFIKSYHDSAYDGLFVGQKGYGHIEAPAEHREEILRIMDQLDEGHG